MKVAIFALVALLLGVGAGLARTLGEFGNVDERFDPFNATRSPLQTTSMPGAGPKIVSAGSDDELTGASIVHNFGVMDRNSQQGYRFQLKNDGQAPLEVKLISTTCKCTSTTVKENETVRIAPGDKLEIPLEWTPKAYERLFRQSAEFTTNDPDHPSFHLIVEGRVTMSIRPDPYEITFGDVPANQPRTAEVRVYSYIDQELQFEGHEFTDAESAKFFDLQVEPLTAAELKTEKDAKGGLLARLIMSEDIPLGPVQQTLKLFTNIKTDGLAMEIPITGKVIGDVSIHTQATYDDNRQLLLLPNVKQGQGHRVVMRLVVSGRFKDEVEVSVDEANTNPPGVLLTSWGRTIRTENGPAIFPLIVEVSRDADVVSRLGPDRDHLGKIVITTTHPDAEKIVIYVRFAIEP